MLKALRYFGMLSVLVAILAFPCVAFAQEVAPDDGGGIPLAPIVLILSIASAIVPLTKLIPGWGTISNIAVGVVAALSAAFTPIAQEHPTMTVGAICVAAVGAILGYFRSDARAKG